VRVEAVTALGQTRYPAASKVVAKVTHLERPTALALLRVLRKDGIQPEPSLAEQVAAATGVCRLRSKELDQYNPDYAAYHVGRFMVEFVSLYNGKAQQEKEKKEPWKIYAHHLSNGLTVMGIDLATPPASEHGAYLAKLTEQANKLLNPIMKESNAKNNPNELSTWLDQNPPKSKAVYKGMPDAVVNEGEKAAGG
jgi:putative SOS response-associated peptidase YedK